LLLKDRIKTIREHLKIGSQSKFAELLNWNLSRVQDLERGKVTTLKPDEAVDIQEKLLVNGWWAFTGKGSMLITDNQANVPTTISANENSNMVQIKYYADVHASAGVGTVNYSEDVQLMSFSQEFIQSYLHLYNTDHIEIINVHGNSMFPTLSSNEIIFIDRDDLLLSEGAIYVVRFYDDVLVKRVSNDSKTKSLTLMSDNTQFPSRIVSGEDDFNNFEVIGRVVSHMELV